MNCYAVRITTATGQFYGAKNLNVGGFGWQRRDGTGVIWLRIDYAILLAQLIVGQLVEVFGVKHVEVVRRDGEVDAIVHADGSIKGVPVSPRKVLAAVGGER